MNIVANERRLGFEDGDLFYKKLLKSEKRKKAYKDWLKWTQSTPFKVNITQRGSRTLGMRRFSTKNPFDEVKGLEVVTMVGRFEDMIISTAKKTVRYLIVEQVGRQVFDYLSLEEDEGISARKSMLESIFCDNSNDENKLKGLKTKLSKRRENFMLRKETLDSIQQRMDDVPEIDVDGSVLDTRRDIASHTFKVFNPLNPLKNTQSYTHGENSQNIGSMIEEGVVKIPELRLMSSGNKSKSKATSKLQNELESAKIDAEIRMRFQEEEDLQMDEELKQNHQRSSQEDLLIPRPKSKPTFEELRTRNTKSSTSKNATSESNPRNNLQLTNNLKSISEKSTSQIDAEEDEDERQKAQRKKQLEGLNQGKLGKTLNKIQKAQVELDIGSVGSVGLRKKIKFSEIEKIIEKLIDPNKYHPNTTIGFMFFVLIILINIVAVYVKKPYLMETMTDVVEMAVTADHFSWEIFAHVQPLWFLTINRMIREGWVSDKDFLMFRPDNSSYVYPKSRFAGSVGFVMWPDNHIDKRLRNITYPKFFNFDAWVNFDSVMQFYDVVYHPDGSSEIKWREEVFSRRAVVKVVQTLSVHLVARDYENDTLEEIVPINMEDPKDREKDPMEEFYKRIVASDFTEKYSLMSYEFYEYLKKVVWQAYNVLRYSTFVAIYGMAGMFVVFVLFLWLQVRRMRVFYRKLFEIKVRLFNFIFNF